MPKTKDKKKPRPQAVGGVASHHRLDFLKPGDKVIIRHNPHHPHAVEIVGTVIVFRPGEGFGGNDLADVHYKHPMKDERHTMPFGVTCLGPADSGSLIALAERHEAIATQLREFAAAKSQ